MTYDGEGKSEEQIVNDRRIIGEALHRPNSSYSNDPGVCECGNLDCSTTVKLQEQIRQMR